MHYERVFQIAVVICLLLQVVPDPLQAQKSDMDKLQGAAWIAAKDYQVIADSLMYGNHPAPLFRKDFTLTGKLKNATLTITAAGYYLASINGKPIENNILDPAWTNFSKRIYYSTYDVTNLLRSGINAIGIELGNGFYNLLPLKMFGRNLRTFLPTGEPQWIARLQLTYADGTTKAIVSDTSWKTADGPLMKNNVYLGVHYDARKEIKG